MTKATKACVILTIATFLGFFVIEALLWPLPLVHELLLPQLNPGFTDPPQTQARILQALFVNQGVYNLLVACGGIAGLLLESRGRRQAGRILVTFVCIFGLGAAVILLASTQAYALGVLQALFPAIALVRLRGEPI